MTGLKRARLAWTIVFLGVTLTAIVMECVAGLWHPAGWTIPWTEYLARYVPWPLQLGAYVILAVWLPFHFWRHDHLRQVAYREGYRDAVDHGNAMRRADQNARAYGWEVGRGAALAESIDSSPENPFF